MPDKNKTSPGGPKSPGILRQVKRPRSGPLAPENRRTVKRYLVPLIFCQVLAPLLPQAEAGVVHLSTSEICLSLTDRIELGALLRLRLSNRRQLCLHEVVLRVTHRRGGAHGLCLASGIFPEELPHDVLRALLS
jgi:hypothetical protein